MQRRNFKLLACDVFTREIGYCMARTPHAIFPVFNPKGEHNHSDRLRALLQSQIDGAAKEDHAYDAILMAYGLCGNSTLGLEARGVPLVVPRAHDCTALFLGSGAAFKEHFADNPSQRWASVGYSEHGGSVISDLDTGEWLMADQATRDLVELYGEENAKYILASMHNEHESDFIYYIDIPETRVDHMVEEIHEQAAASNLTVRRIEGSLRLIDALLAGDWNDAEFLVVPPGHRVGAVYDYDEVIRAEPTPGA